MRMLRLLCHFWLLSFLFPILPAQDDLRMIAHLKIEISELKKEYNSVTEILEEHKRVQQVLRKELEILSNSGMEEKPVMDRVRIQEIKAETRFLVSQMSIFLTKKAYIQKLMEEKKNSLQTLLWKRIQAILSHLQEEQDITIQNQQVENIARHLEEVEKLEYAQAMEQVVSLPFQSLLETWETQEKENLEQCMEKRLFFEHIIEVYSEIHTSGMEEEKKVASHLELLISLKTKTQQSASERYLDKKVASMIERKQKLVSDIKNRIENTSLGIRRAKENLEKIRKREDFLLSGK